MNDKPLTQVERNKKYRKKNAVRHVSFLLIPTKADEAELINKLQKKIADKGVKNTMLEILTFYFERND